MKVKTRLTWLCFLFGIPRKREKQTMIFSLEKLLNQLLEAEQSGGEKDNEEEKFCR